MSIDIIFVVVVVLVVMIVPLCTHILIVFVHINSLCLFDSTRGTAIARLASEHCLGKFQVHHV